MRAIFGFWLCRTGTPATPGDSPQFGSALHSPRRGVGAAVLLSTYKRRGERDRGRWSSRAIREHGTARRSSRRAAGVPSPPRWCRCSQPRPAFPSVCGAPGLGSHRDVSSTVASTSTSMGYFHPGGSSRTRSASRSCGVNVSVSASIPAIPSICTAAPGCVRPEQVPEAVPQEDGPRVDLHLPRPRIASGRPAAAAGPRRSTGSARSSLALAGTRPAAQGSRRRCGPASGLLRQHPQDLGEQRCLGSVGPKAVLGGLHDRHHEPQRLGGGEHQRREPEPAPHRMGSQRQCGLLTDWTQVRLPQDRDVAAGGPFEFRAGPRSGCAVMPGCSGYAERDKRPRGRAHVALIHTPSPYSRTSELTLMPGVEMNMDSAEITADQLTIVPAQRGVLADLQAIPAASDRSGR